MARLPRCRCPPGRSPPRHASHFLATPRAQCRPQQSRDNAAASRAAYERAHFTSLGYVSFDSNARSGHAAREQKTIRIRGAVGSFVKLVVRGCWHNRANAFAQASLVAVQVSLMLRHGATLCHVTNPRSRR